MRQRREGLRAAFRALEPPVVHRDIQGLERLDVVPPEGGDEDGIPRLDIDRFRHRQGLREARVAFQVGGGDFHQAGRLSAGGKVQRPYV